MLVGGGSGISCSSCFGYLAVELARIVGQHQAIRVKRLYFKGFCESFLHPGQGTVCWGDAQPGDDQLV